MIKKVLAGFIIFAILFVVELLRGPRYEEHNGRRARVELRSGSCEKWTRDNSSSLSTISRPNTRSRASPPDSTRSISIIEPKVRAF